MGANPSKASNKELVSFLQLASVIVGMIVSRAGGPPKHAPTGDDAVEYPRPAWLPPDKVIWAVVGQSGIGKSGFINGVRGVKKGHKDWAPEGVTECTDKPELYPCPGIPKALVCDLPGGGTKKHPGSTYCKDKGIRYFNGVVICVRDGRPTEFDAAIMKMCLHHTVPYYIVQNRFQQVVDSEEIDPDDTKAVGDLVSTVKTNVHKVLCGEYNAPCSLSRVFMVNSRNWTFAEGEKFYQCLLSDIEVGKPDEPPAKQRKRDCPVDD